MKEYMRRKYVLFGLVVFGCLVLIVAVAARRSRVTAVGASAKDSAQPPSSLGNYQSLSAPLTDSELKDLIDRSSAIIVGNVTSNICRLSADKESVNTNYTVRVNQVLSGTLRRDSNVLVSMPGGLVMFHPNGSEVTEKNQLKAIAKPIMVEGSDKIVPAGAASSKFTPPSGSPLVNGKTYVLFLSKDPDSNRGFILTDLNNSAQGPYEVGNENAQAQLVNDIRAAVARAAVPQ